MDATSTDLQPQRVSSLAITSSVLGLLSFSCLPIIPAIICGFIALVQIRRSNGRLRGMQWAALGIILPVALVLFGAAYVRLIPGLGWYHDRQFTESVTGVPFVLGAPHLAYDSERAFNGDGYSIAAYNIPDDTLRQLQSEAFPSGPEKTTFRDDWTVVKWKRSPVAPEDSAYVDFAFSSGDSSNAADQISAMAINALSANSSFYAYLHKSSTFDDGGLWILNVDFYIIDMENGVLITVNHNT